MNAFLKTLTQFEKNAFLKVVDNILTSKPKNAAQIEKILTDKSRDLKNIDNINIAKVFDLVQLEFVSYIRDQLINTDSQFDLIADILTRDGNCIMKQDWFGRLYETEIKDFESKVTEFRTRLDPDSKEEIDEARRRDYRIYHACVVAAYQNDEVNNFDKKITVDEMSILTTLAASLQLSQEEVKLINYMVIPIKRRQIDDVVSDLKSTGIVFYSKKSNTLFVPDEIVRLLRKARGKEVSDKYFRRVLRLLREPQINLICRRHNINWRQPLDQKIRSIIKHGISLSGLLSNELHKEGTSVSERKQFLNEFCEKELKTGAVLKGATLTEKVNSLIKYFDDIEQDDKVGISVDGYDKLLVELREAIPTISDTVKNEFQFQEEQVLKSSFLLSYNIKPRDILDLVPVTELENFATSRQIRVRGDLTVNVLDAFKDTENLYLENYENIGFRNLNALKDNGIDIREIDLGSKYEELTKSIFAKLGFQVDEELRRSVNTDKDKIDIILNLGNHELILIECKTSKESGFNKFSAVSRQLKSYSSMLRLNGFNVIKVLLVAPDFSEDFVKDCGLDYELNLSLITSSTLMRILTGFKTSKHKRFPHNLLMRDVLIQEERILAAIER